MTVVLHCSPCVAGDTLLGGTFFFQSNQSEFVFYYFLITSNVTMVCGMTQCSDDDTNNVAIHVSLAVLVLKSQTLTLCRPQTVLLCYHLQKFNPRNHSRATNDAHMRVSGRNSDT